MDVSPKTLREVEFREKMRGYHPEDVDQFLERVAAGIEVLQDRLRQAIERAQRAEQAATEAGGNDDALRRTLLLAQRTADLAVQEAREQAARIIASAEQQTQAAIAETDQRVQTLVADAEQRAQSTLAEAEKRAHIMLSDAEPRAQSMLADAEQRTKAMLADAEHRARRSHDDTLVEVRSDVAKLEATRQRLQLDAETLARWVAEHRAQLRAALEDALTRVDQIDLSPPPTAGAPHLGSQMTDRPPAHEPPAHEPPAPAAAGQPVAHQAPSPNPQPPANVQPQWAPPAQSEQPPVRSTQPAAKSEQPPVRSAQPAGPAPAAEPLGPWQPEPVENDEGGDADPYFAELRRAISEPDQRSPRPEGDHSAAAGGHSAGGGEP